MNNWIEQQIKSLPQNLIAYLASPLLNEEMDRILKKYEMSDEERGLVKEEVYMYVVGATNPMDFLAQIQLFSGLEEEDAEKLTDDLNTYILDPISEDIVNLWMSEVDESAFDQVVDEDSATRIPLAKTITPPSNLPVAPAPTTVHNSLSAPAHKPLQKKAISDNDIAEARKALRDPYRENTK